MSTSEKPRDVSGVELLMNNHQGHKCEIDAREDNFSHCLGLGKELLSRNHYASEDIKAKLGDLTSQRNFMLHKWEERWEHLQLILEVYQFARDAAVAEAWLIAQDPYLKSEELGQTIDEVENLIKKHEAFEKAAAAQEDRFVALERLTTFELQELKKQQEEEEKRRAHESSKPSTPPREKSEAGDVTKSETDSSKTAGGGEPIDSSGRRPSSQGVTDSSSVRVEPVRRSTKPTVTSPGARSEGAKAKHYLPKTSTPAASTSKSPSSDWFGSLTKASRRGSTASEKKIRLEPNKITDDEENLRDVAERPPAEDSELEATLMRKHDWETMTKRAKARSWDRDQKAYKSSPESISPIDLKGANAEIASNYVKKDNVFRLKLSNGGDISFPSQGCRRNGKINHVFQAAMYLEVKDWIAFEDSLLIIFKCENSFRPVKYIKYQHDQMKRGNSKKKVRSESVMEDNASSDDEEEDRFTIINERPVDDISVNFFYKPHTISLLLLSVVGISVIAFSRDENMDSRSNIWSSLFPMVPFTRPHPILWRMQDYNTIRRKNMEPNAGIYPWKSYGHI
ncbi:SPTB [Lepeophtheirus salmonis]|uniref:SPTB n=1 Tax=Lepeophtheirus salmonis TaxID=72036 RepID=A0A7R8H8K1_LEPSM|nr:SPTB [Lepeophtheirus salmonis]CAF2943409.1 SPTB [Lepeophtheirus salmonis]